jgi:thymidine kinase
MGKLYFHYSAMNAGKSTLLLQAAHNYIERGLLVYLLTAKLDNRSGEGQISSRIGLQKAAHTFAEGEDLFVKLGEHFARESCACVFVDESQFLSKEQVWQLARFVDEYNVPVMCYGLRTDFRGELFPGSAALLALADEMREARTICWCGKKATMTARCGSDGKAAKEGDQVQIGGNDGETPLLLSHVPVLRFPWICAKPRTVCLLTRSRSLLAVYVSLCRRHWREEMGDVPKARAKSQPAIKEAATALPSLVDVCDSPAPDRVPMTVGGSDDKGVESPN